MSKVHISIGNDRSLCGLNPQRGNYDIRSFDTFFQTVSDDRCDVCVRRLTERGYSVGKLSSTVSVLSRSAVLADRLTARGA